MQLSATPLGRDKNDNFDSPEFIERLCNLEDAAWSKLVQAYNFDLLSVALKITSRDEALAEDILQEAYVSAMKNIGTFRQQSTIKTWLHSIIAKTALSFGRSKRRRDSRFQLAGDDLDELTPFNDVIGDQHNNYENDSTALRKRTLHAVISTLDIKKRAVLIVQIEEPELETEEIAEKLGLKSDDTVRTRKHYAIRELQGKYQRTFNSGGLPAVLSKINNAAVKRALKMEEKIKHPYLFKSYYIAKHVKHDLEFAVLDLQKKGYTNVKTIRDLNTDNIKAATIIYSGIGEKVNNGMTYIARAGFALGISKSYKDGEKNKPAEILLALKKIAGIQIRDKEYYTAENTRLDLESAVRNFTPRGPKTTKPKTILDLNKEMMQWTKIDCVTGERVSGRTYLVDAAIAFGLADNYNDAVKYIPAVLLILKKIAWGELREKDYYNPSNVYYDLLSGVENFKLNPEKSNNGPSTINQLNTINIKEINIFCRNGEVVNGKDYVSQAGIALGIVKNLTEAHSNLNKILSHLKIIAGSMMRYRAWQWFGKQKSIAN